MYTLRTQFVFEQNTILSAPRKFALIEREAVREREDSGRATLNEGAVKLMVDSNVWEAAERGRHGALVVQ
ncbi:MULTISPECIES: hypothetical protein [unclassified Rhizobium]|uniref:hypothetical protein n=1 Tax=unclassified Rhizobium TaxID=2613769 RepID=UPI0007EAA8C1|nr:MULTISPECIES: hypothetical protein [unclassified Rhizobium]ANK95354.1 hypothetical protein AMK01_PD00475 [Rhizobium sp. N6212]ANL07530.1 hypothetical protein AMJ99_PD00476 [Rhizobium esperanzae]ANL25684.1 hypothetical protein AMJ96_PD00483 [Rhizobium sp. N113]ANM38371.1 hypothetical protein AMK04_PD00477 [Rhizobium sp. N871]ANL01407.1 hypothetical protein AMK00_PD00474 [Rhizobium sp. N621]